MNVSSGPGSTMDAKQGRYVEDVDALRCFAMSSVMILHVGLFPPGWAGVWLFFVISGFAITRSLISDDRSGLPHNTIIGHFYLKRALRILPLYLFYIGVTASIAAILHFENYWAALPWLLTFTYNIAIAFGSPVISAPGVVHLWSISGEEQFYLTFPFLFVFLSRRAFVISMLTLIAVCPIARGVMGVAMDGGPDGMAAARGIPFFTPVHFDSFAAGALIALATNGRQISVRMGYIALLIGFGALAAYVFGYAAIQGLELGTFGLDAFRNILSGRMGGEGREIFAYTAVWMASAGLLIAVIARVPLIAAACRPRIFHAIGRVSYGGYVYHGLVLEILTYAWPGINEGSVAKRLVFLVLLYGLAVGMAFASYRWIEKPFLKLKPKRPQRPVSAQPTAMTETA